ncbi:hypothetical protein ILYODFUR_033674 [Ilyodon furcidens]|uniref:Uncharacterized protein n=1 Tax=Ilyodon furcidens TaxID=33524 RepID=A0ABV0VLX6_9TELE
MLCGGVVSSSWMWVHRHLDRLSGDGRAELDNVSPWAIVAVAVRWCVCVAVEGVAGPGCLSLAGALLLGKFVPSGCGVEVSVVGAVLGGVCPVAPVGGGWGSIAWALSLLLRHAMWWGAGCGGGAWNGAVCGACAVRVWLRQLFGDEAHLWGCAPVLGAWV